MAEITETNLRFGRNLVILREQQNLTQGEVAEKLNLQRAAVYNYERGLRTPPLDTVIKLAEIFSVSIDTLLKADLEKTVAETVPVTVYVDGKRGNAKIPRKEFDAATEKHLQLKISIQL